MCCRGIWGRGGPRHTPPKKKNTPTKKLGNDITDIGKAGAFIRGLLPIIKQYTLLQDRSTLSNAMESAKNSEMSVMGMVKQMIPEELGISKIENRIFKDMNKEKTPVDMDEVIRRMEKMTMAIKTEIKNEIRNERRNYNEIRCFDCGKMGHIRTRCPERNEQRNTDNRQNYRRNENYERNAINI